MVYTKAHTRTEIVHFVMICYGYINFKVTTLSQLWLAVGPQFLQGGLLTNFKMFSFDKTAVAVSGKAGRM